MEGDQHKIREALELAITIGDWCCAQTDDPLECCEFSCAYQVEPHGEAGADCPWKKIRAALSAPPRNCDVGTPQEQYNRFRKFCLQYTFCEQCQLRQLKPEYDICGMRCGFKWAQMPYEKQEGVAK